MRAQITAFSRVRRNKRPHGGGSMQRRSHYPKQYGNDMWQRRSQLPPKNRVSKQEMAKKYGKIRASEVPWGLQVFRTC